MEVKTNIGGSLSKNTHFGYSSQNVGLVNSCFTHLFNIYVEIPIFLKDVYYQEYMINQFT